MPTGNKYRDIRSLPQVSCVSSVFRRIFNGRFHELNAGFRCDRLLDTLFDLTISPCVNNSGGLSRRANTSNSVTVVSMDLPSDERYFLPLSIGLTPFGYRL